MHPEEPEQSQWLEDNLLPHETMLRAWLKSRFSSSCDIDNIVQESYIRVLETNKHTEIKSPKAFMFATARNLALDSMRHSSVSRAEYLDQLAISKFEDKGIDIPETVARRQELELLTKAIQALPDRCRQVFTLRKVYGMSQKNIAQLMSISIHTVSAQLTIGLQKCTNYMKTFRETDSN